MVQATYDHGDYLRPPCKKGLNPVILLSVMIVVITDDDLLLPYLLPWFVATIKTNYPSAEVTEGVTGWKIYIKNCS